MLQTYTQTEAEILEEAKLMLVTLESAFAHFQERLHGLIGRIQQQQGRV